MAAYVQLVSLLSHKRYLGDLKCDDAAVQRARVFGDDRETVAVLYTARPDANVKVKLDLPVVRIEGIDGRALEAAGDGTVAVPDGLSYVWLDRAKLGERLRTDTPAMRLWAIALREPPKRPAASPIVLRLEADRKVMQAKSEGYRISAFPSVVDGHLLPNGRATKLPLSVKVFNLATKPQELELTLALPEGGKLVAGSPSQSVQVAAEGSADVAWQADLGPAFSEADRVTVKVTAVADPAAEMTPLSIDLIAIAGSAQ